jgi:8-oxo-dGTP pyrophosphatase MutT (NUDIX family)
MIDIAALKKRLSEPLPGFHAQAKLMPMGRKIVADFDDLVPAAVMIILIKRGDKWTIPLIERSHDDYAHSGQIALPGGRLDPNEGALEAAIRETEEEIGLKLELKNVLGPISPLPIPVSNYLVQPFVSVFRGQPEYDIDTREVAKVFEFDLDLLNNESTLKNKMMKFKFGEMSVPYYETNGYTVWGATAMILSEFSAIIAEI